MFKSEKNRNHKPIEIMPIQVKVVKKGSSILSLEDFLRKYKLTLTIERGEDREQDRRYAVYTHQLGQETEGGGSYYMPFGCGQFADMALRTFIAQIQGKRLTLNSGRTYFTCEQLEWDGIMREEVQVKKAKE
ncbi:MAG: hypothetical protein WCJ74_00825 [bacterium]